MIDILQDKKLFLFNKLNFYAYFIIFLKFKIFSLRILNYQETKNISCYNYSEIFIFIFTKII